MSKKATISILVAIISILTASLVVCMVMLPNDLVVQIAINNSNPTKINKFVILPILYLLGVVPPLLYLKQKNNKYFLYSLFSFILIVATFCLNYFIK